MTTTMTGLIIDETACRGCGACVRACASHGVEMVGERPDRTARVTDGCILCGMCVDACPFDAIELVRATASDPAAEKALEAADVWVFAQQADGAVAPVVFELLGKARELADARGCRVVALLGLGDGSGATDETPLDADPIGELITRGADEVVFCRDERLAAPSTDVYARWICDLAAERSPEILLFGATSFGRELAPTVAARLQTGLTADCTVLQIDAETGLLHQTRPAFGGNLMATIMCPDRRPQMATVRAGVLPAAEPDASRTGLRTETRLAADNLPAVRVVERQPAGDDDSIADAEVLVVVGRGIGSQKNLPLMEHLAELLGAKLGCSRPLVEAGWCEYRRQVGQTGLSVAPKLLVSIGVSGAIQHLAGIGGAQTVIAVNSDPSAPIFGVSQYSAVGDCVEIVRAWVGLLER